MLRNIMAESPNRNVKPFILLSKFSSNIPFRFSHQPSSMSRTIGMTALKANQNVSDTLNHSLSRGRPGLFTAAFLYPMAFLSLPYFVYSFAS